MKDTERDKWDELFRARLQNLEAETAEDDWELIASRLPAGKPVVVLRPYWKYVAAAAVVSFLVVTVTLTLYKQNEQALSSGQIAEKQKQDIERVQENRQRLFAEKQENEPVVPVVTAPQETDLRAAVKKRMISQVELLDISVIAEKSDQWISLSLVEVEDTEAGADKAETISRKVRTQASADVPEHAVYTRSSETAAAKIPGSRRKARKWNFGMGGGSLAVGTSNSVGSLLEPGVRSPYAIENGLVLMNMAAASNAPVKTDIDHHLPVSFGFSVGKSLNERFSLQSGLVYTYLTSDWKTDGTYTGEFNQKLHYIGIPLSVVYKIAQWDKFVLYASGGGMGEVNVAGKINAKMFSPEHTKMQESTEHIRMKQWLWSVRGNVGVSYPLVRFVNVFAETGASYYFDNGSDIETIRSEKPFNVDFQLGFRFGF
ncbi:MAG: PorT family protein [Parabacteroides sp.]|nr:PorT family protein [Parabacteroides sp.]